MAAQQQQQELVDVLEYDAVRDEREEREAAVALARSIREVTEIQESLNEMLIDQQPELDTIENSVGQSSENMTAAVAELAQAERTRAEQYKVYGTGFGTVLGTTVGIIGGPVGMGIGAAAGAAVGRLIGGVTTSTVQGYVSREEASYQERESAAAAQPARPSPKIEQLREAAARAEAKAAEPLGNESPLPAPTRRRARWGEPVPADAEAVAPPATVATTATAPRTLSNEQRVEAAAKQSLRATGRGCEIVASQGTQLRGVVPELDRQDDALRTANRIQNANTFTGVITNLFSWGSRADSAAAIDESAGVPAPTTTTTTATTAAVGGTRTRSVRGQLSDEESDEVITIIREVKAAVSDMGGELATQNGILDDVAVKVESASNRTKQQNARIDRG